MARKANGSGDNGETRMAKAPAKTPARRRADKPRQSASATEKTSARVSEATAGNGAVHTPSLAEVQRRAFELFVQRGGGHGHDKEDWLEAERQLRQGH